MKTIAFVKWSMVLYLCIIAPFQLQSQENNLLESQILIDSQGDTLLLIPVRNIRAALFLFDAKDRLNKGLERQVASQHNLLYLRSKIITEQAMTLAEKDTILGLRDIQLSYQKKRVDNLERQIKARTWGVYGLGALLVLSIIF